jgi:hypothetical protein
VNQNDDEYDPPAILKLQVNKSEIPKSVDSTPLVNFEVPSHPWIKSTPAVTGDFATKGPSPPEPPTMVSESTGNYPSMVDDLDAGDMEGRTKMAFAKMQTPAELRESYVFDDTDFDAQQDDEGNLSSEGNSPRLDMPDSPGKEGGDAGMNSFEIQLEQDMPLLKPEPKRVKSTQKPVASKGKARRIEEEEKQAQEGKSATGEEESKVQKMTVEEKAVTLGLYS